MAVFKNIKTKYHAIPAAVKVSLWFAICSILQKGISFVTVPLFTRMMTSVQYGQFSIYQSWYSIISVFATLNLSYGVFNNGMTKYPNDRNRLLSSMQGLSTTVTLLLFIIYLFFQKYINALTGLSTVMMLVMFAEFLMAPALSFWSTRQRYEFKYIALVIVTLGISIASPLVGFLAVMNSVNKGFARIISIALINVCVGLFFYIFNAIKGKVFFVREYWLFALKFNLPLIPHYLSMIVLAQSDKIMIEHLCGEAEVAIYSVAHSLSLVMNIVTNSINAAYIPWTYQVLSKNKLGVLKKTSNTLLIGIATISWIPVILAPELMWIMAPVEYGEAIWVIPPISTSVFFTFLYSLFGNIEFYFEKNKFVMVASMIGAVSNIALNAWLMPIFGYLAAGYTTMICYMLFAIAHYIFMRKVCKEKLSVKSVYDDKMIALISAMYLACTIIAMCTYKFVILRYGVLFVVSIFVVIKRNKIISFLKIIKNK